MRNRTIMDIAEMIIGDYQFQGNSYFIYRSSSYITQFFRDCETGFEHDGSTRRHWVAWAIEEILKEPRSDPSMPPEEFATLICILMDREDVQEADDDERSKALGCLNRALAREQLEAFYAEDGNCYLRNSKTKNVAKAGHNKNRVFSREELKKRETLLGYLKNCSEDELIENVLHPLFKVLGFNRISVAGHKDKAQEFGKDMWMKLPLPTAHMIYFGVQAKRGKLDSAGKGRNTNITEILNQVRMMIAHPIFDPDTNKKHLVDHAFIVAGGEITKQAKQFLAENLDASQRSQILFMDRDEILDLFISHRVDLPESIKSAT